MAAHSCIAYHYTFLQKVEQPYLYNHVVGSEHPFAVFQFCELLYYSDIVHEVHVTALGDGKVATFHLIRRVVEYTDVSAETEVLRVVGYKAQTDTSVAVYAESVDDVETVESDGIAAYGRCEPLLEQGDLLVIYIDVGKEIFQCGNKKVARLEGIVHAVGPVALYYFPFAVRLPAIYLLCKGLGLHHGQYQLVVVRA